jgi:hypothetical protein
LDGRSPTESDYDLASTMEGADSIRISSEDPFWRERGWEAQAGVVVVVGVRQADAGSYTLILTTPDPANSDVGTLQVGDKLQVTLPALPSGETTRTYSQIF